MMSRFGFCARAALLLLFSFSPFLGAAAQSPPLLEFVPSDAVAVLSVHPREIAALSEFEFFPREVITAAGLKEWTVDPLDIEKALLVAGPVTNQEAPAFFAILRFPAAASAQKVLSEKRQNAKPERLANKDLYHTKEGVDLLFLDEKTVAIGDEKSLRWMLEAKDQAGPFIELLKKSPKKHLSLALHVEPVRPVLVQGFAGAPNPLNELAKGCEITRFAQVDADLKLGGEWRITLTAKGEPEAAALKAMTQRQLEFLSEVIRKQLPALTSSQDPVQRSWADYLTRASQRLAKLATPNTAGAEVTLTLKSDQALTTTLGLFASTAAPSILAASARAERAVDENRLKQLLRAMHNHHDTYNGFPARASTNDAGKPLLSWRVHLLPFIEQQALYDQFHLDEPWDSDHNKKLIDKMPDVFRSRGEAADSTKTRFLTLIGEGVLLDEKKNISLANVTDGTSNTIAIVQASKEKAAIWTKPDDFTFDPKKPIEGLLEGDAQGFLAALADGSVRWIPASVEAATLNALFSRGGGEVISLQFE